MSRYLIWAIVVAIVAIAAYEIVPLFTAPGTRGGGPQALVGETAAIYALRDDRGSPVSLTQYRGRIVIMNLWASWCPPCRAEMPDLQRLQTAYARDRIAIIGVNEGESAQRARSFADSLGIRFPVWIDGSQRYGRTYAALGLPTTIILDRQGVVVRGFDGALTFAQMEGAVTPLVRPR
jgi:thiol-disulfide isomerase/thioredoxin